MFDFLRGGDQPRVVDGGFRLFIDHLPSFFDQTFHCRALDASRGQLKCFENSFEPFHVTFGLVQVFFETGTKPVRRGGFGHFRKRLEQLFFGVIDVPQLVYKQVVQRLERSHCVFLLCQKDHFPICPPISLFARQDTLKQLPCHPTPSRANRLWHQKCTAQLRIEELPRDSVDRLSWPSATESIK